MMLDPFGAMVIQRLTSYLSPTEDTIRLGMPAILLFNRLLWLAIGGAVLALLARRLEFELSGDTGSRRKKAKGFLTAKDATVHKGPQLPGAFSKAPAVDVLFANLASFAVDKHRATFLLLQHVREVDLVDCRLP